MAFARIPSDRLAETRASLAAAVSAHRAGEPLPGANPPPAVRRSSDEYDGVDLVPLRDYVTSRERQTFALAFGLAMSLIALVLLNAGALAAARAQQRIRDIAIRRAIGARPRDLFRHALVEQILLATAGAAAGLLMAPLLLALVLDRLPPGLTLLKVVRIDWRVVMFAGLVTAAAAVVVSLLSLRVALRRTGVVPALADVHGRSPARVRLGRWLVAGQTAIAFALVLGGALFASSLARLWTEDPGLRTANVVTMRLSYPEFPSTAMKAKVLALAQRSREVPGVRGAALVDAPVMQNVERRSLFFPPPSPAAIDGPTPTVIRVSSDFFATAGVQLLAGRLPSSVELDAGTPVIAVSESAARAYWPDQPAIGQVLRGGRGSQTVDCTVVGVVPDIRLVALDVRSTGVIFVPWSLAVRTEFGDNNLVLLLESSAPAVIAQIRDRVSALDQAVRVSDVQLLEEAVANSIRDRRLGAFAASGFGMVALLFVALGLVGLVTMTAGRRTREIGIRLTLGAVPGGVARLLVAEQLGAAAAGLVAGGILAAWAVPMVGARLYGVGVYDFGVWGASATAILATAVLSAWLPARRASRIDPVASLRNT